MYSLLRMLTLDSIPYCIVCVLESHLYLSIQYGRTALAWAARCGHLAVVQALCDRGAHLEAKDVVSRPDLFDVYTRKDLLHAF